jgi:hypothetical protein
MQEYRAYIIGPKIQQRIDLLCPDYEAAKERAEKLADGHDVKLWQFNRRIAEFKRKE